MKQHKTQKSVTNYRKLHQLLERYVAECAALSKNEKKERLSRLSAFCNPENYSLTTVALTALTIGGNALGAEYFKRLVPFEIREAYFLSSYRLMTDEDSENMHFFQDMFIDDPGTLNARIANLLEEREGKFALRQANIMECSI